MSYNFKEFEEKWAKRWTDDKTFAAIDFDPRPHFYILTEFPGVSGKSMHMGHACTFTYSDIYARYKRLKGFNVLYPVGWDAFGLPTENYAIKTGEKPSVVTQKNIETFRAQFARLGISFDFERAVSTAAPDYYKWTQWIFLKLYKHGLAYKQKGTVNYCPNCKTTLSNEDSQGGECDRCHGKVEQRQRDVWYLKMTDYAEKMLEDHAHMEMAPHIKMMQHNWIGKSEGAEVDFPIFGSDDKIKVFTTRPDTLFGVTFMVIAPEHPLITKFSGQIKNIAAVCDYIKSVKNKTDIERQATKEKTGILLQGITAVNPVNGKQIPVFTADYVMMTYGTGAIMAVPAHDERDFDFAKYANIDIIQVIDGGTGAEAFTGDGKLINSEFLNGLNTTDAKKCMIDYLVAHNFGNATVKYKMGDWPFNRQRYWGEPFPMVYCENCGWQPLSESDLPLVLPDIDDYLPNANGDSPLSKYPEFVNTICPNCGGAAKRETDTMPNWAGSSWYWLRFLDPHNNDAFASKEKLNYWGAVDLYTGGEEHVTRHMLYASFWNHFLYDIGEIPFKYPFKKRMCNGLVLGPDGNKMSKSLGNIVDPTEMINKYGADAVRLYLIFSGEFEKNKIWLEQGIKGCLKFLNSVFNLQDILVDGDISAQHDIMLNKLIKKVEEDILNFSFNTSISEFMIFINQIAKDNFITKAELKIFLILLNPYAPFITSEMFNKIFESEISKQQFPTFDPSKLSGNTMELPIQVNGKLKGKIVIAQDASQAEILAAAKAELSLENVLKEIYVPKKIINFIVKSN